MVIYLDHNATTPVDPRVLTAMLPLFTESFANPSSTHQSGRAVAELVQIARHQVADLVGVPLGVQGYDVIFTSGATEAITFALRGVLAGGNAIAGRNRIVAGATEHKAVLDAARLAITPARGLLTVVNATADSTLDLDHFRTLLDGDVALVALMAANNETGAVTNVRRISRLAHEAGALVFCDVTQAAGKLPVRLAEWQVDLAVLSAHKIGGPKGVGALVGRREVLRRLTPLVVGGAQECGLRAGTLNTPGIVGFGAAAHLAAAEQPAEARRQARLTRLLLNSLTQRLSAVHLNGPVRGRLPNTLNVRFAGAPADAVMTCVPDVAMSSGAACYGGTGEPSHVLLAMGQDRATAAEAIRFSVGRSTTEEQVRQAAALVAVGVEHVRGLRGALARWRGAGPPSDRATTWS